MFWEKLAHKSILIYQFEIQKNIFNLTFNVFYPISILCNNFSNTQKVKRIFVFHVNLLSMFEFLKIFKCSRLVSDFAIVNLMSILRVCGSFPENRKRDEFVIIRRLKTQMNSSNYFNL